MKRRTPPRRQAGCFFIDGKARRLRTYYPAQCWSFPSMRLTIKPLTAEKNAFMVKQKFAAISKGSLIGTRNLMNCLGVVLHNRVAGVGIVAHVEAQTNLNDYTKVANNILEFLLTKLNERGGQTGSLSLVLLGNNNTKSDDSKKVVINRDLFGMRLNKLDFADLQGQANACVLDPDGNNEILWTEGASAKSFIADLPKQPGDVGFLPIQK
jgi:hypothetical protein